MSNTNERRNDSSDHISKLFTYHFKNYLIKNNSLSGNETIIYDLEMNDAFQIKEKLRSGNFFHKDQFAYTILNTFLYALGEESIEKGSKINIYLEKIRELDIDGSEEVIKDLILLVFCLLLNTIIQVKYGLSFALTDLEHLRTKLQDEYERYINRTKSVGFVAQFLGAATFVASDSKLLKGAGATGLAYGVYNNYMKKDDNGTSGINSLNEVNNGILRVISEQLSQLVAGAQISTNISKSDIDDDELLNLKDGLLKKWAICCKYCFSTPEFKFYLVENTCYQPLDSRLKRVLTKNSNYIFESTDIEPKDLLELQSMIKKSSNSGIIIVFGVISVLFFTIFVNLDDLIGKITLMVLYLAISIVFFSIWHNKNDSTSWEEINKRYENLLDRMKFYT